MCPFRPPRLIESDTLLLRPPKPEDAQALFDDMFSDEETMRFLSFSRHTRIEETRAYIEESLEGWETGWMIRWVVEDKATGSLTALLQLMPQPPRAELGLILSRRGPSRRRRTGLKALRTLIKWIVAQPLIYRLYAYCAVDGTAHTSMERLGFVREARITNHEARPNLGLPAGDSYLFAMTRPVEVPKPTPAATWLASLEYEPV